MMQFLMRAPHHRLHVHTDLLEPTVTLLICSLCCRVVPEDYACAMINLGVAMLRRGRVQ